MEEGGVFLLNALFYNISARDHVERALDNAYHVSASACRPKYGIGIPIGQLAVVLESVPPTWSPLLRVLFLGGRLPPVFGYPGAGTMTNTMTSLHNISDSKWLASLQYT